MEATSGRLVYVGVADKGFMRDGKSVHPGNHAGSSRSMVVTLIQQGFGDMEPEFVQRISGVCCDQDASTAILLREKYPNVNVLHGRSMRVSFWSY